MKNEPWYNILAVFARLYYDNLSELTTVFVLATACSFTEAEQAYLVGRGVWMNTSRVLHGDVLYVNNLNNVRVTQQQTRAHY